MAFTLKALRRPLYIVATLAVAAVALSLTFRTKPTTSLPPNQDTLNQALGYSLDLLL